MAPMNPVAFAPVDPRTSGGGGSSANWNSEGDNASNSLQLRSISNPNNSSSAGMDVFDNILNDSPDVITTSYGTRALIYSWIFILLVAILIAILLVWLLVLLRRRFKQTRFLFYFRLSPQLQKLLSENGGSNLRGTEVDGKKVNIDQSPRAKTRTESAGAALATAGNKHRYLLDSSSNTSSSLTSSSSSNENNELRRRGKRGENFDSLAAATCLSEKLRCMDSMRALVDHTNAYLITLTYQEIISCLVAFIFAILNIVRTRNLFCCNLALFLLIASKSLKSLTLVIFSLTKCARLFRLSPLGSSNEGQQRRGDVINDRQEEDTAIQKCCSTTTTSKSSSVKRRPHSRLAVLDANATSRRLIIEEEEEEEIDSLEPIASGEHSPLREHKSNGRDGVKINMSAATNCSRMSPVKLIRATNKPKQLISPSTDKTASLTNFKASSEPIAFRLFLMALISCLIALVCLYARLMGVSVSSNGVVLFTDQQQVKLQRNVARNSTATPPLISAASDSGDWSISIFGPASATETTTRYTTRGDTTTLSPLATPGTNESDAKQPNFQATWSARLQQSSMLRHLVEQYELNQFAHLLLDTHQQTSQYSCTLAPGNQVPAMINALLFIYLATIGVILAGSFSILYLGRSKLRLFLSRHGDDVGRCNGSLIQLASPASVDWFEQFSLDHPPPLHQMNPVALNSHPKMGELVVGSFGKQKSSRASGGSKKYNALIKQTLRNHRSSSPSLGGEMDLNLQANRLRQGQSSLVFPAARASVNHQANNGDSKNTKRNYLLRNSSSMSSLFRPTSAAANGRGSLCASVERSSTVNSQQPLCGKRSAKQQRNAGKRGAPLCRRVASHSNLSHHQQSHPQHCRVSPVSNGVSKLAVSTQGGLVWLPLSNAATAASLSNIAESVKRQPARANYGRCDAGNAPDSSPSSSTSSPSDTADSPNSTSSTSCPPTTSSSSPSLGLPQASPVWPLLQQDELRASSLLDNKKRLIYQELKQDLRLSQAIILYNLLLDQAPILVST